MKEQGKKTKGKDPERILREMPGCACFSIRKASRAVTQLYDEALKPAGLRATQLNLLAVAAVRGPATISQLGEVLVMDRTTLTRNLRPLEREGLIEIGPGEDRRTREVRPTAKGREALSRAFPLWKKAQERLIGALGESRWSRMRADLAKAVSAAQGG